MKITLYLLLILVVCSCKKNITIDIPNEVDKPVVNLLINKDSLLLARLTFSGYIGKWVKYPEIKNAVVKLYENGLFRENLDTVVRNRAMFYKSTIKARAGATYRITVNIPGYPEMEGSDMVPEEAVTGEMTVKKVAGRADVRALVTLELHDKQGVKNYYRVRIYQRYIDSQAQVYKILQSFAAGDPTDGMFSKKDRSEFFVDDAWFDGRSPRFSFLTTHYSPEGKIMVEISSLTYSSYTYLFTAFNAREKNDDPLAEKVIVFNNIINGLGIVGGVTQREYIIDK
jgi:hypothetical protein